MNEDALIDQVIDALVNIIESGEEVDDALLGQLAEVISDIVNERQGGSQEPIQTTLPQGVDLLWILSGSNPQVFTEYARTFPDAAINALARNPAQLQAAISRLSSQITQPAGEVADGVPKQPLNSSNIYGFQYNPRDGKLKVRFNSGSVYSYDGVPPQVFKMFQQGAIPARTSGQNRWGRWWIGKKPSSGASFYELIRDRFPYRRLS